MRTNLCGKDSVLFATFSTLVGLGLILAGFAQAAWVPTKPVEFVVPAGPGGGSDVMARAITGILDAEKLVPVTVLVVNKAGGGGTVGTTAVSQQRGNQHTLVTYHLGQVVAPIVAGGGSATFKDLTLIASLAIDEQVLVVKSDAPYKTVKEFLAGAKERSGAMTVGGTATGQDDHMANRLVEREGNVKLRYVPFNSGGETLTALMGKHVDAIWANPGEFAPQMEAKQVRPLAVAGENRLSFMPDAPTFKEQGYNVIWKVFRGVAAPPGIPAETIAYYENLMKRMSESARWKDGYLKRYMLSSAWMGSQEFTQFVAQQEQVSRGILKELGLIK